MLRFATWGAKPGPFECSLSPRTFELKDYVPRTQIVLSSPALSKVTFWPNS